MNKTDKLLTVIRDFDDAFTERMSTCIPDEIASLFLQYMLEPEPFWRDALLHYLTEWAETLPERTRGDVYKEFKALVKVILHYCE